MLWREVVTRVGGAYPDVELSHMCGARVAGPGCTAPASPRSGATGPGASGAAGAARAGTWTTRPCSSCAARAASTRWSPATSSATSCPTRPLCSPAAWACCPPPASQRAAPASTSRCAWAAPRRARGRRAQRALSGPASAGARLRARHRRAGRCQPHGHGAQRGDDVPLRAGPAPGAPAHTPARCGGAAPRLLHRAAHNARPGGLPQVAERLERAVAAVLDAGYRTRDLMSEGKREVGCSELGGLLEAHL